MPEEIGANAPLTDASAATGSALSSAGDTSAPSTGSTSSAPSEQIAGTASAGSVQGESSTTESDPLAGVPSLDDINKLPDDSQYKKSLVQMRTAIEQTFKPQLTELQTKYQAVEPFTETLQRFERPDQLTESLQLSESLIGWEQGANGLEPATEKGAALIAEKFPLHADYLAADLLRMESVDPETGQRMPRIDIALKGMAQDPAERAKVAQMFGLVEPSSISPQWQPSAEELAKLYADPSNPTADEKALADIYRKLPYEEREELKLSSPEYVISQLKKEKLLQELAANKTQTEQREAQRVQQREEYIKRQADSAGDQYVQTRETEALTTFHNSVVADCTFIQPLDPANLPEGVTPEQAAQFNKQADETNKAEAAEITLSVIGLVNPQTRPFVLPLLKQIGAIDDATVKMIEEASEKFGNNGRNYGHLEYRGKMTANGNGYQPDQSITTLKNNADNGLKLLIHAANQIKKNLIEKKGQTFAMKANGYNSTLNNVATSRPSPNGTTFNPATATTQQPSRWATRQELEAQYG